MWWIIYSVISTVFFLLIINYTRNNNSNYDDIIDIMCAFFLFTLCLPHNLIVMLFHFTCVCLKGHNYSIKIFGIYFEEKNPKYMSDKELVNYELSKFKNKDIERYLREKKLEKLNT